MTRRAILTPQVLAEIPALLEQGLRKTDIAELLGCKASTLQVRCSVAGISLRGAKRRRLDPGGGIALSPVAIAGLKERAHLMGCSETQLASDLLEMIARDNLYDAVLDSAPLQPLGNAFEASKNRRGPLGQHLAEPAAAAGLICQQPGEVNALPKSEHGLG